MTPPPTWRRAARRLLVVTALAVAVSGCLGEPEIEDRWTRLDLESASLTPYQALPVGSTPTVNVRAAITYRSILTGFVVAELRASSTITPAEVTVHPDAARLPMAQDIDRILANSVTLGRATRAVTGWDHLIQRLDLSFAGVVPSAIDTSGAAPGSVFLLCYLGEGEEVERQDGSDTLIVTPFDSMQYQILPIGMEFGLGTPAP